MVFRDIDKQALLENAATVITKIRIVGTDIEFTEDDYVAEWTYEDFRYVPENGFIGQFVERLFDGKLLQIPDGVSLENQEINMQLGIVNNLDNKTTFYDYGNFIVTELSVADTTGQYTYKSSDYTKRFNVPYVDNISYPCLALELAQDACGQANVELASDGQALCSIIGDDGLPMGTYTFIIENDETGINDYYTFSTTKDLKKSDSLMLIMNKHIVIQKSITDDFKVIRDELTYIEGEYESSTPIPYTLVNYVDFINNDFVIENNQFESNETLRDVMKAIAKLAYTWVRVGVDNKVHLDFTNKTEEDIESYNEITTDDYYETKKQDLYYGPVNKVLVGMSQVDGENIVNDMSTDKLIASSIDGKCEQKGTPTPATPVEIQSVRGAENLFTFSPVTQVINGITWEAKEDGTIVANGTATDTSTFTIRKMNLDSGTYTMSGCIDGGEDSYKLLVYRTDNWAMWTDWGKGTTFTISAGKEFEFRCRVMKDYTADNVIFKPMLEIGNTKHDYIPYGNWLGQKIIGKNLYTTNVDSTSLNGLTFDINDDNTIEVRGDYQTSTYFTINNHLVIAPNTEYTLSGAVSGSQRLRLRELDSDGNVLTDRFAAADGLTFISDANVAYCNLQIVITSLPETVVFEPQLERGTTITPYEKYNESISLIDMNKHNLFDGELELGMYDASTGEKTTNNNNYRNKNFIEVEPNTTYTFSINGASQKYVVYNYTNDEKLINVSTLTSGTFTTPDNCNYINFRCFNSDFTPNYNQLNIYLLKGNDVLPYYELSSIEDIKDTFGNGVITKRIGKIVFDGSDDEKWILADAGISGVTRYNIIISDVKSGTGIPHLCNSNTIRTDEPYTQYREYSWLSNKGYYYQVDINTIGGNTVTAFKTWLSHNPITVYYILENEETYNVNYEKINLFDGPNQVISNDIVQPNMYITTTSILGDKTYSGSILNIDIDSADECVLNIYDNPLTYTENLRRIAINGSESLIGLKYLPFNTVTVGHPWLEGDDYIKLTNLNGDDLYTYPFDRKLTYKGYIKSEITSEAKTTNEQKYEQSSDIIRRLSHTEIIVDKQNATITSTVEKVDEVGKTATEAQQTANGFSQRIDKVEENNAAYDERITTIEADLEGVTTSRTVVGGSNLIKNSVGYFGSDYWMIDDDHEGSVTANTTTEVSNNSISGSALQLKNEVIYQTINSIKTGDYYLSFGYVKLNDYAKCSIIVNEDIIDLDSSTWVVVEKPLDITTNSIKIQLECNIDDACLITDLMLVNGNAKVSWTQNTNETFTDNVKIGKGIEITATGSDTKLEATTSGINIKNAQTNETTSVFNKYGTETNEMTVHGKAIIEDTLLINKVGEQIWISMI